VESYTKSESKMITARTPLSTPGFFETPAIPLGPGILPGVLPQDGAALMGLGGGMGQDMVSSVMFDMMMSMQELQQSFAMYMGGAFLPR